MMQAADGTGLFPGRSLQVCGTDEGTHMENEVSVGPSLAFKFCEDPQKCNWKSASSFLQLVCAWLLWSVQFLCVMCNAGDLMS